MSIFNNMRLYANTLMLHMASIENMEAKVSAPRRYWCIFVYSNILVLSKFLTEDEKKWN